MQGDFMGSNMARITFSTIVSEIFRGRRLEIAGT